MRSSKKFDKELFDQYDDFGRTKVKDFFIANFNLTLIDNPDIYGVDLIVYHKTKKLGYVEVEVRNSWKTDIFPFDTLNVPSRKKKLLTNDMLTYFVSINKTGTRAFMCSDNTVLTSPLEESRNKFVSSNEYFYKVQLNRLKILNL